ncbi:MAG: hypothetical protein ACLP1X_14285 [Polyangiaceae bacterium]
MQDFLPTEYGEDATPPAATAPHEALGAVRGDVRFATAEERDSSVQTLVHAGMIVVELEGIGPSMRGRLADALAEAVERELAARGAPGPGLASTGDLDGALSDQLFRTRRAGAAGLALVLGPLRAAAGFSSALEPADCATLRFLAEATRERPVILILDKRDMQTGGYGDPVPLAGLLRNEEEKGPAPDRDRDRDHDRAPSLQPSPALARHTTGANVVTQEESWRAWTLQLAAARGPQPLAALERLFAESYMPLANAVSAGLEDPRARAAQDEFRNAFTKGYSDAFPTFAATTKRPRMVLDAHDLAARIARLHGARSVRLLLVDAMRWDLARLVEERVVSRLGNRAALTDELILWSALPTTTMRQLETIARGVEALRAPAAIDPDSEAEAPRGRTAEYVRRLRVGPRELHKLDVVQARLQGTREGTLDALPALADTTADVIARHAETLSPRTLLFVFGDHGFVIDRNGAALQGGASPEEVLVGAFALLLGDVH